MCCRRRHMRNCNKTFCEILHWNLAETQPYECVYVWGGYNIIVLYL